MVLTWKGIIKMKSSIADNLYDLYASYRQHKELFEFYQKFKNMKNVDEIKSRIDYIKKNKVKQRSELSTLLWILGEVDETYD